MTTARRYASGDQSLTSHRRMQATRALRAKRLPCWLCGKPIDYTAHHNSPWAFCVDEVIPRSKGGSSLDPANLRPAHRWCNGSRNNRAPTRTAGPPIPLVAPARSRPWYG